MTNRRQMIKISKNILFYMLIGIIFVYLVFPFYWAINTSLKNKAQLIMTPATMIPKDPNTGTISLTFENFIYVFKNKQFFLGMLNSAFVSGTVTMLSLLFGMFASFAFGKLRFRGKHMGLYLILAMTLFPQISILTGIYKIMEVLQMSAYANMIFTYMIFSLPFTIWVLTSFITALPNSLLEAARVDGASFIQILVYVFIPLLAPAMVTTGILAFIGAWNEYLFALVFTLTDERAQTVSVRLARFSGKYAYEEPYGEIMAAAIMITIPLIILVLVFQKRIIAGLTAGAEKG